MDESRAAKLAKKDSSPNNTTNPSMKEHYEKAFPADLVIDRDSPAYLMALNYLKAYGSQPIIFVFVSWLTLIQPTATRNTPMASKRSLKSKASIISLSVAPNFLRGD